MYRRIPYIDSPAIRAAEEKLTTALWEFHHNGGNDRRVDAAAGRLEEAELKAWEKMQESADRW